MNLPFKPPGPTVAAIREAGACVNCHGASFADTLDAIMQERVRGNRILDHLHADERDLHRRLADASDPDEAIRQAVAPLITSHRPRAEISLAAYRAAAAFWQCCACDLTIARVEEILAFEVRKAGARRHG